MARFPCLAASLRLSLIGVSLILAACADDPATDTPASKDPEKITLKELETLADGGRYDDVLSIISDRKQLGLAGTEELRLALKLNLEKLDGIAAEVLADRLLELGVPRSTLYVPKARALFLQGQLDKALDLLNADDLSPEDITDARLLRADIAGLKGNEEEQVSLYKQVIATRPDDFRGYLGMALHVFERADFATAETYAAQALARDNQDPIANYAVGATALYQGDYGKAQTYLEKSVSLRPGNVAALTELATLFIRQGDTEKAEQTLDQIYEVAPNNRMARYLTAQIAAEKGDLDEAERLLILSEDFARTYLPASRTYGLVSYSLGKYAIAERYLKRFLAVVPTDRNVRMALVDSLTKQTNGGEALSYLAPVLEETPNDMDANLYAASAKAAEGEPQAALAYYEKVLALMDAAPDADPVQTRRLRIKIAISRFLMGEADLASRELQAIQSDDLGDFDTLVLLANIHLRRYDNQGLRAVLNEMEAVRPGSLEAQNFRGIMAYRSGDLDAAIAAYSKALEQNADYFSALKNRGLALLSAERPRDAQSDLLKAAAMNPDDGQVQAFLGRSYLELDDFESAATYLKKAEIVLPHEPLILLDYSESLAGRGLLHLAIRKAQDAKRYAVERKNTDMVDYIDNLVAEWEKTLKDRDTPEEEEAPENAGSR